MYDREGFTDLLACGRVFLPSLRKSQFSIEAHDFQINEVFFELFIQSWLLMNLKIFNQVLLLRGFGVLGFWGFGVL